MSKMESDYGHLLNIDFNAPYRIPFTGSEAMIFTSGRASERLDGLWNFSVDVFDTFKRKEFYKEITSDENGNRIPIDCDFDGWEKVMLPSNWNTSNEKYYYYEGTAVYTRTFHYQPNNPEERVFIKVGAANYECNLWLNGKHISRHRGGFTPFFTELTEHLKTDNRIILTVNNKREMEQIPSVNYDWFNYGGIFRSIELFRTPKLFIKDMFAYLVPDGCFNKIKVQLTISENKAGIECSFAIPDLGVSLKLETNSEGIATAEISANPKLWSTDSPHLYEIKATCGQDTVKDKVGFREIKVEGKEILLNGKPIFLKGVCCHEEGIYNGRVLTIDERLEVLHTAKALGCNIIRLSHYPHSEQMSQLADSLGIMLWEEIPVYWALRFDLEDTYNDAANQLRELILRDRNRASVVIWSIGNENPDTDQRLKFMTGLAEICRSLDNSRPISAACLVNVDAMQVKDRLCNVVDIVSFNEYYGWYYRDYNGLADILNNTNLDKPLVISETGAGAHPGHYGGDEELFTEEHQAKVYKQQFAISHGKIQGIFPWILYDFRSPVRLHPMQNQHNRKGLISFDKKHKKLAFDTVKNYYSSL